MIPELGHFALVLALVLSLVQAVVPMVGAQPQRFALMAVGRPAAQGQFFFILFSYVCLTWAFIQSDFSVQLARATRTAQRR
jgi:cytochrome c-type biogenesis protein CcmF